VAEGPPIPSRALAFFSLSLVLLGGMTGPAAALTLYVHAASGDDANDGRSPATALATITRAALIALPGDRVLVGRGTYREGGLAPAAYGRVEFVADRNGEAGFGAGDAVIDASDCAGTRCKAAFDLNGKLAVTIDGFVVYGASVGIYVKSQSDQCRVLNNIVSANAEQGIYLQDSKNVIVFNNLVYANGREGIRITGNIPNDQNGGSPGAKVINNTVYANGDRGIFFAGTDIGSFESLTINNVVENNRMSEIQINPTSMPGHVNAGNVTLGRVPNEIGDATDVQGSALFLDPDGADDIFGGAGYADDDFHLPQDGESRSPAVDAGVIEAARLGFATASTSIDGRADSGLVDAGYHYRHTGSVIVPSPDKLRFAPIYVDATSGKDASDGTTPDRAVRTIARALRMSQRGNRILIGSGTYAEGDLLISGLNGNDNRQDASLPGPNGLARELRIEGEPGVVIDATIGCRNGLGAAVRCLRGFRFERESRVVLSGVEITGAGAQAIQVRRDSELTATNVKLRGNTDEGFEVLQNSIATLSKFESSGNGGVGIDAGNIGDTSQLTLSDGVISDNARNDGLRLRGGTFEIFRTTVERNGNGGVAVDGASRFVFDGGRVANNAANGIEIEGTDDATVSDSVVTANGDGITITDSAGTTVWNNLVYSNRSTGISVVGTATGSPNAQILNNTIYGNGQRGLVVGGGDFGPPSPGATVLRNIFASNVTAGINVNSGSLEDYVGDYNLSADPYGPFTPVGFHDIIGDPKLVDPAAAAFQLQQIEAGQQQQSAAVNAGGMTAAAAGVAHLTTRRDGVADTGEADLGFHYEQFQTVDCDGDGAMNVAEVVRAINVALGSLPMSECEGLDVDRDGGLGVDELLLGVSHLLVAGS
jgi:parallel beta-helix repeat protein